MSEAASTKADDVALELEQAIVSGELAPGTVLRQERLSEQYGVSRTPIREALRRLAALGLVSFEPNRGVRVRTLTRAELREAFLIRAELESLATEIAAAHRAMVSLAGNTDGPFGHQAAASALISVRVGPAGVGRQPSLRSCRTRSSTGSRSAPTAPRCR